ncbi:MAG: hypothetical protein QM723_38715 [Myxococcaceae bacterium]
MADSDFSSRLSRLERALDADKKSLGDRHSRHLERRAERRRAKQEEERRNASFPGGAFALAIAIAIAVYGFTHPQMWWLLFVALGIGSGGARQLALAARRDGETKKEKAEEREAPVDRAEQLCDELIQELETSPEAVRAFLGQPEKTIESLRTACRQLTERHQAVSTLADDKASAELEAEKAKLSRNMGDLDPATYQRAVAALKLREDLLRQVKSSANKLESEREILLTSLQSLKMRLALAKSSGQPANIDGVRAEVDRLGEELSAISESLEAAQTLGLPAVAPIEDGSSRQTPGEKERA